MNKEKLKEFTLHLEQAFKDSEHLSADIKAFSKYAPLVSAMARAKAGLISEAEALPAMGYWLFETDLQAHPNVELAFARFSNLLEGLERG